MHGFDFEIHFQVSGQTAPRIPYARRENCPVSNNINQSVTVILLLLSVTLETVLKN